MHGVRNPFSSVITVFQILQRLILHPICPQIFLKIKRIHWYNLLKSNRIRSHFFIPHSKQRTRFYIVKPAILHKKFDCWTYRRTLLHLIKQNQCLSRFQWCLKICGQIRNNYLCRQSIVENICCFFICHKIYFCKMFILIFSKFPD